MLPDDATGSVYHGSPAHISHPPSASAREDAFFSGIGKWRRSRSRYLFVENCCFMRRDVDRAASLRADPSIYALYGIICAQRPQSGNASAHRLHIKGCSFERPSVPDSSLALGMTVCFAQNDSDLSAELFCSGRVFPPFPVSVPRRLPAL